MLDDEGSSSARKRKRDDDPGENQSRTRPQPRRTSSRDLMPPPLPISRITEQRSSLSKPQPASRSTRPALESRQSIRVYEGHAWKPEQSQHVVQQPTRQRPLPGRNTSEMPQNERIEASFTPLNESYDREHSIARPDMQVAQEAMVFQQDPMNNTAQGVEGLSRLSLQSPGRQQKTHYEAVRDPRNPSAQSDVMRRRHAPQLAPHTAAAGQVEQPQVDRSRAYVRGLPKSYETHQTSLFTIPQARYATPSPQRATLRPDAPVSSPFFGRAGTALHPVMQRPPAREIYTRTQYATSHDVGRADYTDAQVNRNLARARGEPQRPHALPRLGRQAHSINHRPPRQVPGYKADHSGQRNEPFAVPQTPRNSQGLFQRPDRLRPPSSYAMSRPRSDMYTGRVTLPPTSGPPTYMAGRQDTALSQIPGVRGLSSQRGMPEYHHPAAGYNAPRILFSSAGAPSGRRSVRR